MLIACYFPPRLNLFAPLYDRLSLRAAAKRFGIPRNTLARRNKNNNLGFYGSGSTIVLSELTELLIVRMINLMFIQFWKNI